MRYAVLVALLLAGCAETAMQRAEKVCPVRARNYEEYKDCMNFYQRQQLIDGQNAAAAAAANGALLQGSAAMYGASRPQPMFPAPALPTQTDCWRYGNNVSCSSR